MSFYRQYIDSPTGSHWHRIFKAKWGENRRHNDPGIIKKRAHCSSMGLVMKRSDRVKRPSSLKRRRKKRRK